MSAIVHAGDEDDLKEREWLVIKRLFANEVLGLGNHQTNSYHNVPIVNVIWLPLLVN